MLLQPLQLGISAATELALTQYLAHGSSVLALKSVPKKSTRGFTLLSVFTPLVRVSLGFSGLTGGLIFCTSARLVGVPGKPRLLAGVTRPCRGPRQAAFACWGD